MFVHIFARKVLVLSLAQIARFFATLKDVQKEEKYTQPISLTKSRMLGKMLKERNDRRNVNTTMRIRHIIV